jgi:hypothetical protein
MKSLLGLIAAVSGLALAGCSTANYSVQQTKADSLAGLTSFAWGDKTKSQTGGDISNRPLYLAQVRKDVESEMIGKGYARVPERDAKLTLETTLVSQPIAAEQVDGIFESKRDAGSAPKAEVFEPGTVIVNVENARTQKVLWRGAMIKVVDRTQPLAAQKVVIKKAVIGLMQQMPSAQ